MRSRLLLMIVPALLGAAVVGAAASVPDADTHRCKRGFRHAVIAGKHQCLKVGQRCNRRFDRQYHRYGFHCHTGRLTRRRPPPAPTLPPPPPPPPPLPPPPPPTADLVVAKTDSLDPVRIGNDLTYTVTVTNAGPDSAAAVQATDTLPSDVTLISVTPSQGSCTGTTTVVCSLGAISSGASATVTIVVQPTVSGTLTNRANATTSTQDANAANNAAEESTTVIPRGPPPPPPPP